MKILDTILLLLLLACSYESNANDRKEIKVKNETNHLPRDNIDTESNYTFVVAVIAKGIFLCGGTLISENHVLTAAHCCFNGTVPLSPKSIVVMAGSANWRKGRKRYVSKCIPHDRFNSLAKTDDVGIVVLEKLMLIDSKVSTIRLNPFSISNTKPLRARALTWKLENGTGAYSTKLFTENVTTIPSKECKAIQDKMGNNHICIMTEEAKSLCRVTSGGPLVTYSKRKFLQIGIINYDEDFCVKSIPQLFSQVSAYYTWIRSTMRKVMTYSTFRSDPLKHRRRFYEYTEQEVKSVKVKSS